MSYFPQAISSCFAPKRQDNDIEMQRLTDDVGTANGEEAPKPQGSSSICNVNDLASLFQAKLCLGDERSAPYEPVSPQFATKDLCRSIPFGLVNDTPSGRKFSPLTADLLLMSLFSAGAMIFPVPLSIALSEDAGLVLKNTMRGIETLFLNKADKSAEEVKRELLLLLARAQQNPEIAGAMGEKLKNLTALLLGRVEKGRDEVVKELTALLAQLPEDSQTAQALQAQMGRLNVQEEPQEESQEHALAFAAVVSLLQQAQENPEISQAVRERLKSVATLILNRAEIKAEEVVKELAQLLPEVQEDPEIAEALQEQIEQFTKAKESTDRAKLLVKIVKYIIFAGAAGIGGGVDLYRMVQNVPSLQLLAKAGGILSVALDRDLVEYLRPEKKSDPNNPTGREIKVHKEMWKKLAILGATAGAGTACILGDVNPILTNGLLNAANTATKMVGKDNKMAARFCNISLIIVTILSTLANGAGFGLRQWVDIGTYLKYASPLMIASLKLASSAGQRAILEKLTGDDGEDDDEENKKEAAPLPVRVGVLAIAILASMAALYYKFSQPNQLSCLIPNGNSANSTMPTGTQSANTQQIDEVQRLMTYAIGLLMAVPLKITGRVAKSVMDELPRARVLTPLVGATVLTAEAISYPYQCQMSIIAIVAFTCFAAMASKLIAGAIKDFMIGEKPKKTKPEKVAAPGASPKEVKVKVKKDKPKK